MAILSPLIQEYLRLGEWIGGEPARDPDFNIADLLAFLPLAHVEARCVDRLLQARQAARPGLTVSWAPARDAPGRAGWRRGGRNP